MTELPPGTEVPYTVTWLEMTARPEYDWPSAPSGPQVALLRAKNPPVWYFRALYGAVGRDYAWEDMPDKDDAEIARWLDPSRMALYSLIGEGWPKGFFVLDEVDSETTDLAYFGLVPEAVGQNLGRWLLRTAILTAWTRQGLRRLTVNTCTLDHPRALGLYQKNGFTPVRREDFTRILKRPLTPAHISG